MHPNDLIEFLKKEAWDQILKNCKRPPQVVNAAGNLADQHPFLLPERSLLRLKTAALVDEYYSHTLSTLTAMNMAWNRLSNF